MDIQITFGIGEGSTKLAAFDAALFDAGIANFNLIYLSSIIPPKCNVFAQKANLNDKYIGQKLYIVPSYSVLDTKGAVSYIGLGWLFLKESGGFFVEYNSEKEEEVLSYIHDTIHSMNRYRSIESEPQVKIIKIECEARPISGIIAAIYKVEKW